jgi:hypothetical protein
MLGVIAIFDYDLNLNRLQKLWLNFHWKFLPELRTEDSYSQNNV